MNCPGCFGLEKRLLIIVSVLCFAFTGGHFQRASAQNQKPKISAVQFREVSVAQDKATFTLEVIGEGFGTSPAGVSIAFLDATGASVAQVTKLEVSSDNKIVVVAQVPLGATITGIKLTRQAATVETSEFKLAVKAPPPPPQFTSFEIKHITRKSPQFPNLYTLLVTNDDGKFASNPNRMSVEIVPAGASNATIRPGVNPYQMIVDFMAPVDFEVKDVIVTVYDSSDLDKRNPVAIAQPFKDKPQPANPNQISISNVEVLSLQRYRGKGRIKIEGSGFGNYRRPPCTSEQFISEQPNPGFELEPAPTPRPAATPNACLGDWVDEIEQSVKINLVPRNTDLQVKRTAITYIDDKLIDVYFEFTNFEGYSQPFRLASTTVTVKKPGTKPVQTVKGDGVVATVSGPETFLAKSDFGPKRDGNLEYHFTILSKKQANSLFGRGVADNFYVIQLSVVNRGPKKVTIPLAAIQAEIEWAYTPGPVNDFFEGPATLPPLPLAGVSGFFEAYNRTEGNRAKLFNILDAIATVGTSIIPFVGSGFKTSQLIFTGGVIPGVRLGFGDISGQQLQNLTALSWQNVEVVSAAGGSVDKFIYIQRGAQVFNGETKPDMKKEIKNIRGLEVTGFEVIESEAKQATPTPQ